MRPSTQSGSASTAPPAEDEDGKAARWCCSFRPASRYTVVKGAEKPPNAFCVKLVAQGSVSGSA